jgi:REP element-mobilizing transposase RayT
VYQPQGSVVSTAAIYPDLSRAQGAGQVLCHDSGLILHRIWSHPPGAPTMCSPRPVTPPREQPAGGFFHAGIRSIDGRRLFADSNDYEALLSYLGRARDRFGWLVLGYCLMPNHVHLIVETPEAVLGKAMGHVNQSYAQRFNRRRDRAGHVQQSRYWSRILDQ